MGWAAACTPVAPALGAFLSPDTIIPDPATVSDYNRFLYARANPLKYTDPSGHIGVCFQGSPATEVENQGALGKFCNELGEEGLLGQGDGTKKYNVFANDADDKWAAWEWIQKTLADNPDEPINLIGYSWGGAAALEFASFLNEEGVAVNSMILIDPVVRLHASGRVATGDTMPSVWTNVIRYIAPAAPGNVVRTLNLYAPEQEDFAFLEGRTTIYGALNVPVEGTHHGSIMNHNRPRYGSGSSIGISANRLSSKGEKVNQLTLNLAEFWLRTGVVPDIP